MNNSSKNLKTLGLLILVLFIVFLLVYKTKQDKDINQNTVKQAENEKDFSKQIPAPTDTESLEEQAEKSLKSADELMPKSTETKSLEEQAKEKGVDVSEFIPEPTDVEPL